MTLDELKVKYQVLADTCEKQGDEYHKQAQDLVLKGQYANHYYDKAASEYNIATMYMHFVNELCKIETK